MGSFPKTSSEAFILNEMVELVRMGHEIHIVADRKRTDKAHQDAIEYGLVDRTIAPRREYRRGLEKSVDFMFKASWEFVKHPILTTGLMREIRRYVKDPWMIMDIYLSLLQIRDLDVDIVHSPFSNSKNLTKAYLISRMKKVPYTISMRAREIYHAGEMKDMKKCQEIIESSSAVITISNYNISYIKRNLGIGDIKLVRSSIDPEKFKPVKAEKRRKITTIGRFIEKKGIEYLIEALSIMDKKGYRDLEFLLIGEGPLEAKYRRMLEDLGLSDRSTLRSDLTQEEILSELSDTMVFCLPSVVASDKDMDMLPNVIKEAMAMEIPVLTTNMPGMGELIKNGENGILVEPRDHRELAESLIELMEDPALRSFLGKNGRRTIIRDFSTDKEAKKLERIFIDAVQG
ncbi:MAG: glycosyltransferase family 4 protein [Thermoplasmatota archaeon]